MRKLWILLIGPEWVGKTVIAESLFNNTKKEPKIYRPTVGVRILEFERKIQVDGSDFTVSVLLYDLSGNL